MLILYIQLILITIITAISCTILGSFLILQGNALISDALSHAILFGIVIAFLIVQNINSPLIFLCAIFAGIFTFALTQTLTKIGTLHQDAAIGLIFPFLFSIAVVLINLYAHNVHIDCDAILLGELAFTPFEQFSFLTYDLGPAALWKMSCILCINIFSTSYFYKEFIIATCDHAYAQTINYHPTLFHYFLIILTSITIVQAFHVTGTILVISFMITPAATAFLINKKLLHMIIASCCIATIGVLSGFLCAHLSDVSIAGSIASMNGLIFFIVMLQQYCKK